MLTENIKMMNPKIFLICKRLAGGDIAGTQQRLSELTGQFSPRM